MGGLKRVVSRESFFINEFSSPNGGRLGLAPVYSGDMKAKALQLWADKLEGLVSNYFEEYTATPMPSGEKPEGMNVN